MTVRETWPHSPAHLVTAQIFTRSFPARPASVREARRFAAGVLKCSPVTDDAILCLSELASNSVLHSASRRPGATFTVRAEVREGQHIRIEVADNGGPWTEHDHGDTHQHGLAIVRALAADSGRDGSAATGWIVWARLDWPPAAERDSAAGPI